MFSKNRDIFTHSHLEEYSRSEERQKTAELLLYYSQNKIVSEEEYLKDPNTMSALFGALNTYYPGLNIKYGVHFSLYYKCIFNLGT